MFKSLKDMDKYTKYAVFIIIVGILLRFLLVIPYHVAGDACWHLSSARFIAENMEIPLNEQLGRQQPFWSPPLFHFAAALFYKIFSIFGDLAADFSMKLISPIFGSFSLILVFLILKSLTNQKISLFGTIFMAFLPISLDYSVFSYTDGMLVFFILLSIYFALKNKLLLTSVSIALACLTKYTGFFLFPFILYLIYLKNKKTFLKKSLFLILISGLIISPWYIRNWILLGNPVYPILNTFFGGVSTGTTYSGFNFSNLFSIYTIISPFLETFGVPNGDPALFNFINVPFFSLLFAAWVISTIVFISPIFFGFSISKQNKKITLFWFGPFLFAGILHILNVAVVLGRRLLPAYPSIALIWANGLNNILKKIKYKKTILALLGLIIFGLVFTEIIKIGYSARQWSQFDGDFFWVRENTPKDSLFMVGGQCLVYNLNRQNLLVRSNNIEKSDYIWINENPRLKQLSQSFMDTELINNIRNSNFELVYINDKTKTSIYKVK